MVTTRNMTSNIDRRDIVDEQKDIQEMMRMMQQRMDKMQHNYEAQLRILQEENVAFRKRREKTRYPRHQLSQIPQGKAGFNRAVKGSIRDGPTRKGY